MRQWWEDPSKSTVQDYRVIELPELPQTPVEQLFSHYPTVDKPVFFGHYWLTGDHVLQKPNVCCLDYSVAKGGCLVAYSWDGMSALDFTNFMTISRA